jgi:hypothetical protein
MTESRSIGVLRDVAQSAFPLSDEAGRGGWQMPGLFESPYALDRFAEEFHRAGFVLWITGEGCLGEKAVRNGERHFLFRREVAERGETLKR